MIDLRNDVFIGNMCGRGMVAILRNNSDGSCRPVAGVISNLADGSCRAVSRG